MQHELIAVEEVSFYNFASGFPLIQFIHEILLLPLTTELHPSATVDRKGVTLKLSMQSTYFPRLSALTAEKGCFIMFWITSVLCLHSLFFHLIFLRHVSWQIVCGLQLLTFCHKTHFSHIWVTVQPDDCDRQHSDVLGLLMLQLMMIFTYY